MNAQNQDLFIDRYQTHPSRETLKRLHQEPDPGNQPADLVNAGLDQTQRLKAMKYAMASKADLARTYSHEFMKYFSDLSYSVLNGWIRENAPKEIQDLFEAVVILSNDVAAIEGPAGLHDPHYALVSELIATVSQLIPRLGGKFEEFSEF